MLVRHGLERERLEGAYAVVDIFHARHEVRWRQNCCDGGTKQETLVLFECLVKNNVPMHVLFLGWHRRSELADGVKVHNGPIEGCTHIAAHTFLEFQVVAHKHHQSEDGLDAPKFGLDGAAEHEGTADIF